MIDSATRMAFLTFLPFVLTAKGASLQTVGLALTLVFAGGAAGKLVCAFIGARIGVVATVWLTETVTALGIMVLLPLPLKRPWYCCRWWALRLTAHHPCSMVQCPIWWSRPAASALSGFSIPARLVPAQYRRRLWRAWRYDRRAHDTDRRCRSCPADVADYIHLAAGTGGTFVLTVTGSRDMILIWLTTAAGRMSR